MRINPNDANKFLEKFSDKKSPLFSLDELKNLKVGESLKIGV